IWKNNLACQVIFKAKSIGISIRSIENICQQQGYGPTIRELLSVKTLARSYRTEHWTAEEVDAVEGAKISKCQGCSKNKGAGVNECEFEVKVNSVIGAIPKVEIKENKGYPNFTKEFIYTRFRDDTKSRTSSEQQITDMVPVEDRETEIIRQIGLETSLEEALIGQLVTNKRYEGRQLVASEMTWLNLSNKSRAQISRKQLEDAFFGNNGLDKSQAREGMLRELLSMEVERRCKAVIISSKEQSQSLKTLFEVRRKEKKVQESKAVPSQSA
ncbi:13479_t:CDS:2, partial [Gigaspora rosea]